MALAPLAHVLWTRVMTYDAAAPDWPDRDRFVLSAGHASILLYSMLHLTGYGLSLEDLRGFRQWGSRTPGHPEVHRTEGVEVTTGPLGQGFANAVGLALAERLVRSRFGADVCDHRVFCVASDGDLSEGLSHEAASLAGHLGLGRLIVVYDDNRVSIDGPTELALSDDAPARFTAYGWHVEDLGATGEDLDAIEAALRRAADVEDRPSLIVLRTHIAYPSPDHTDDHQAHGYALFDDAISATKAVLRLPDEPFYVPADVLALYREAGARGRAARGAWEQRLAAREPDATLTAALDGVGLPDWEDALPTWEPGAAVATRKAGAACLQALAPVVPGLVAGGADLTSNTGTVLEGYGVQGRDQPAGRQIYFGVREHAMAASMNGMALHGGVVPVGGTFLVFSDYCRPALRLAAMSQAKAIFVFTHDSLGVGEDGPTHQPVEHVMSLRAVPGLRVIRPADANETAAAWKLAVEHDGPTALILTRQDVPVLEGTAGAAVELGAHVLRAAPDADVVLLGTGSEVAVCLEAATLLAEGGVEAQVVSMPCWELFEDAPEPYQDDVLPPGVPTLAVEAGVSLGWDRWADDVVAVDRFGASAPGARVLAEYGFTAENVANRARALLEP
jgi:transketolase